jgi:hypothetical protein
MIFDQRVQRTERGGASAHLVGQRRQAQFDTLAGIALALPVQRLMLAELLKQNHRQQARTGEAARCDMERRRRLGDCFALPAGKPFANRLDHLPLAGDDLERLRHVFAKLRQFRRAAARAVGWGYHHDPLARQIFRERLPDRPLALKGFDGGRGRSAFRRKFILGRVGLRILQLHLQLVDEPLLAFRARAIERATQLFDLQPQPRDQRIGAGCGRLRMGEIGFRLRRARLARKPRRPLGEDQRMRGDQIGGERIKRVRHIRRES